MSKKIYFHNPGLIDLSAVTTLGVSVKDEGAIGYFGTGLKFAIATILRAGGSITIWRGTEPHTLGALKQDIRGQSFDVVTLDGKPLGFTTKLGRNWEAWMAYRELACNAFDEGGFDTDSEIQPAANATTIVVECDEIRKAHIDRHSFLVLPDEKPVFETKQCQAFPIKASGDFLFYRGVRVSTDQYRSLFRYNTLKTAELTEDRTLKYQFQGTDPIAAMWLRCENKALLREVLSADDQHLEHEIDWATCGETPGKAWLETVAQLGRENVRLGPYIERAYERATSKSATLPTESIPLRADQKTALSEEISFLCRAGFMVDSHEVIVTDRLGKGVLGRAANGKIYLSIEAFMMGDSTLAGTILEEWIHLTRGFEDTTRAMQNWLFDALISQAKRADFLEQKTGK